MNTIPATVYGDGDWERTIAFAEAYIKGDGDVIEFLGIPLIRGVIPTFDIPVNPVIHISEVKGRRFYISDSNQIKAKEEATNVS